jgi:hypothetical protein
MKGSCECGNEPSDYVKCREFFRVAEDLVFSEEKHRSLASVSQLISQTNIFVRGDCRIL